MESRPACDSFFKERYLVGHQPIADNGPSVRLDVREAALSVTKFRSRVEPRSATRQNRPHFNRHAQKRGASFRGSILPLPQLPVQRAGS